MEKSEKQFTNFKIHTQYSICEGAIKIEDLASFCKLNNIKAAGICDYDNLCGALEFSEKISKAGTQPIIGSQINFVSENLISRIPLFASTETGYKNLIKLSSKSFLTRNKLSVPHCKLDDLYNNADGLIALSGGLNDFFGILFSANKIKVINQIFDRLSQIFKDKFYLEIQRHNEPGEKSFEEFLLKLSNDFNLPIIASQEIYYLEQKMSEAHDSLVCIKNKTFLDEKNRKRYSSEHYIKNFKELEKIYSDIPEALENNYNFPYRFNFKPKKSNPILPKIKGNEDNSVETELLNQAQNGLKLRLENYIFKNNNLTSKSELKKKYQDRLIHEINIINSMNYSSYFLIVSDYIK